MLWLSRMRRVLYWVIPVALLALVFRQIEWPTLVRHLQNTNPWWVLAGIVYYPLVVLIGALRWHVLLRRCFGPEARPALAVRHYWIGLAIGLFGPASVGWDAYRVVAAARRLGHVASQVAILVFEKLAALLICVSLIVLLYPFLDVAASPMLRTILEGASVLLLASMVALALMNRLGLGSGPTGAMAWAAALLAAFLKRLAAAGGGDPAGAGAALDLGALMKPFVGWRPMLATGGLSLAIQVAAAAGNQLFFRALGYDLPFTVNLFVLPILFIAFLLPISFGSLGIREGSYVLLYGQFGVPAEVALAVSAFNLAGMMLNCAVGGAWLFLHGFDRGGEAIRRPT